MTNADRLKAAVATASDLPGFAELVRERVLGRLQDDDEGLAAFATGDRERLKHLEFHAGDGFHLAARRAALAFTDGDLESAAVLAEDTFRRGGARAWAASVLEARSARISAGVKFWEGVVEKASGAAFDGAIAAYNFQSKRFEPDPENRRFGAFKVAARKLQESPRGLLNLLDYKEAERELLAKMLGQLAPRPGNDNPDWPEYLSGQSTARAGCVEPWPKDENLPSGDIDPKSFGVPDRLAERFPLVQLTQVAWGPKLLDHPIAESYYCWDVFYRTATGEFGAVPEPHREPAMHLRWLRDEHGAGQLLYWRPRNNNTAYGYLIQIPG